MSLCQCGCGLATTIAQYNRASYGYVKGEPHKFVSGHNAKTGKRREYGYTMKRRRPGPNGYMFEHRLRAEKALGHPLPPKSEVHHLDETKLPNAPLVICPDRSYHKLLHVRSRVKKSGGDPNTDKICSRCKEVKSKASFYRHSREYDGLNDTCKPCTDHSNSLRRQVRL